MQDWLLYGSWAPLLLRLLYGVEKKVSSPALHLGPRSILSPPQQHFLAKLRLCRAVLPPDLRSDISGKKLCPVFHSCSRCGGRVSSGL